MDCRHLDYGQVNTYKGVSMNNLGNEQGMIHFVRLVLLTGLILASCSSVLTSRDSSTSSESGDDIDVSNGDRIYFTASSKRADRIAYQGGPNFGGMMGTYLTCASCHGPEARGGVHTMHMQVMEAPDIRYVALNNTEAEHEGEAHAGEERGEYDLEDFRLAVIDGKHPSDESLSRDMPRWRMTDEDLTDLFAFLKSIE
jgi:hypothetical protein